LNNLLQGAIFTAVDLSEIASELDQQESAIMDNEFRAKNSANVDDSGNFSVQVLRSALNRAKSLDLDPWFQRSNGESDIDPLTQQGFIINRSQHWFTIRKIGDRWWNLNSTSEKPELISQFYLSAFIHQLRADGYSVFTVTGKNLPSHGVQDKFEYRQGGGEWYSEDELLGVGRGGVQAEPVNPFSGKGNRLGGAGSSIHNDASTSVDERDFQMYGDGNEDEDEEMMLARAISASMETAREADTSKKTAETGVSAGNPVVILSAKDEQRAKRLAALEKRGL
jgi:ataxin-3